MVYPSRLTSYSDTCLLGDKNHKILAVDNRSQLLGD